MKIIRMVIALNVMLIGASASGLYALTLQVSDDMEDLEARREVPAPMLTVTPKAWARVPYRVGETLEYLIGWGKVLSAGEARVEVEESFDFRGHETYKVVATAKSNAIISLFHQNRIRLESLIDRHGLFSRRYWNYQYENRRLRERIFEFDHENNTAIYKEDEYYIPYGVQDEVSSVFFMRTLAFKVGEAVYVDIFSKPNIWRVKCNVIKTEKIKVPAGEFDTIVVEPELRFDGVMKKGNVRVWFTNDERRIPVQVKSKIAIGSILIRLKDFRVGHPLEEQESEVPNEQFTRK
ncbi:MAG: DUF3108 domain-containing protein [bacterium]|nr:DUF3108 domain-containing protein [bacterium]